jgi:hypothetical protein
MGSVAGKTSYLALIRILPKKSTPLEHKPLDFVIQIGNVMALCKRYQRVNDFKLGLDHILSIRNIDLIKAQPKSSSPSKN